MIGQKEKEGFAASLDRHAGEEEHALGEYRNLSCLLKSGPAGLLIPHFFLTKSTITSCFGRCSDKELCALGSLSAGGQAELGRHASRP
jgi:hypothetical protein